MRPRSKIETVDTEKKDEEEKKIRYSRWDWNSNWLCVRVACAKRERENIRGKKCAYSRLNSHAQFARIIFYSFLYSRKNTFDSASPCRCYCWRWPGGRMGEWGRAAAYQWDTQYIILRQYTTYQTTQEIMVSSSAKRNIPYVTHNNRLCRIGGTIQYDVFRCPSTQRFECFQKFNSRWYAGDTFHHFHLKRFVAETHPLVDRLKT